MSTTVISCTTPSSPLCNVSVSACLHYLSVQTAQNSSLTSIYELLVVSNYWLKCLFLHHPGGLFACVLVNGGCNERGCKEARKRDMGEERRKSQDIRGVLYLLSDRAAL